MKSNPTVVAIDLAKRVFQLHGVESKTGEIKELKLSRATCLDHFANRAPVSDHDGGVWEHPSLRSSVVGSGAPCG